MACLQQDYPLASKVPYYFPINQFIHSVVLNFQNLDEAEREVIDALHKSLKYCDLETAGAKLPVYQFRAAKIHHRLASLHHAQYR